MPSPTTGAGPSMSVAALALSAPDRTAVVDASRRITWAELARLVSDRTASLLQPAPGRPAFLIPKPDLNALVDILAHWEAHMPAVLVSPKLTSAEQDALKSHADSIAEPLPDGTAFVVFTSGTTGLPKPAILTRESLTAGARAMIRALRMTSSDVLQLSLSPARVGGLGIIMRTLAAGSTIALSPGFSGARFPETLGRDGVTFASLVPAMLADVLERNADWRNPPHLRAILIGGAPFPDRLRAEAARRGIPIMTTYGMTETGSTSAVSAYETRLSPVPVGEVPLAGTSFRTVDGVLCLKGPMLFSGYWGRPAPVHDGWFETGDAGLVNHDGSIRILGRPPTSLSRAAKRSFPPKSSRPLNLSPGFARRSSSACPMKSGGRSSRLFSSPTPIPIRSLTPSSADLPHASPDGSLLDASHGSAPCRSPPRASEAETPRFFGT